MTEGAGATPQDPPRLRRPVFTLVVLAAVVAGVFLAFMLAATQGTFVPQVVDLYLVCQYARALVEGHPFRYNAGELPSTGATSLLYTVVLALPEAIGIRGEGLIAFAIVMGAGFYAASVLLASSVATRLAGPREGLLAGLLVVFGGPVVWSFLYGSDIALFLFLALWLLERWLASADAGVPLWTIPGVLVALARPEGLPIALALAVAWTLRSGRAPAARIDPRPWLPVAAGLAVLALYRLVTGSWLGTSVEDKSLLASYGVNQGLAIASEYGVDVVRGLLLGLIHRRSRSDSGAAGPRSSSPLAPRLHRGGRDRTATGAAARHRRLARDGRGPVRAGHAQRLPRRPVPALRALGLPGLPGPDCRRARARDDLGHP